MKIESHLSELRHESQIEASELQPLFLFMHACKCDEEKYLNTLFSLFPFHLLLLSPTLPSKKEERVRDGGKNSRTTYLRTSPEQEQSPIARVRRRRRRRLSVVSSPVLSFVPWMITFDRTLFFFTSSSSFLHASITLACVFLFFLELRT